MALFCALVLLVMGAFRAWVWFFEKQMKANLGAGQDHPKWVKDKALLQRLSPIKGLCSVLDAPLALLVFSDLLGFTLYWPIMALTIVAGLLLHYSALIKPFYMYFRAFVGLERATPNKPRYWLMRMRLSHLSYDVKSKYNYTYSFYKLACRLLVCNVFGHRWGNFEHNKYANGGRGRGCKACGIHHNETNGVDSYYETHRGAGWDRITDPYSVFKREYPKKDQ